MPVSLDRARAQAIASSPLTVGQVLAGHLRIHRIIGVGGMAYVYEARRGDGARLAVKCLLPALAVDAACVARFLREAQATARVRSPHVARIFETSGGGAGVPPYFVMEYLDGQDLGAELETRGPLSVAAAVDVVMQACEGVAAAHAQGIVHRDIKPSNLIRCGRTIKVVDFGIAKSREPGEGTLTETSETFGSPSYMSPEQVRSAKRVDTRTDVWSLGVVLYELLTGTVPFVGDNAGAILAAIVADAPAPVRERAPHVPAALEAIVLRCLAKDRDRRVQTMGELRTLLGALPPAAGDSTQITRPPRSLLRALWLGLPVALIVGSATYLVVARRSAPAQRPVSAPRDATNAPSPTPLDAPPLPSAPTGESPAVPTSRPTALRTASAPAVPLHFKPCTRDDQCGPLEKCYPGGCSCVSGVMRCGDKCRRAGATRNDCGCGTVCAEDEICVYNADNSARCGKCPPGEVLCSGDACIDRQSDSSHCGACNHPCAKGSECISGACVVKVPYGSPCTGATVCGHGMRCLGGVCKCPVWEYFCHGSCGTSPCLPP